MWLEVANLSLPSAYDKFFEIRDCMGHYRDIWNNALENEVRPL